MKPNSTSESQPARATVTRELGPHARECSAWFRRLTSALKIGRLHESSNPAAIRARSQIVESMLHLVRESRGWTLRFTPNEILLDHEAVVRQRTIRDENGNASPADEKQLPFLFYRDGIRGIRIPADVPRQEAGGLFDVLLSTDAGSDHKDLVSLFWQAHLECIQVDSVPLEQTIYVSSAPNEAATAILKAPAPRTLGPAVSPAAAAPGVPGSTPRPFDDWALVRGSFEVESAYARLVASMEASVARFRAEWDEERTRDWRESAPAVLRQMLATDPSESTRRVVTHAVVSWIGEALQRLSLDETQRAVELLRELDPGLALAERELAPILAHLDHGAIVDYLDRAEPDEQGRFAAVAVCLGKPAVDLAFSVMSRTRDERVRAAACTALCYLCADEPERLAPYFPDAQGDVMLHLVFTLGQIGGPDAVDLLRLAGRHPEPKVRKQVVLALGGVPASVRVQPLIDALDNTDPQVVVAALQMLGREKSAKVTHAILRKASTAEFEALPEDLQWSFFGLLSEVAGDEAVPGISKLVLDGGLLAKRSYIRSAAARALGRIGTEKARAALEAGTKSFAPAVRQACRDALMESP